MILLIEAKGPWFSGMPRPRVRYCDPNRLLPACHRRARCHHHSVCFHTDM